MDWHHQATNEDKNKRIYDISDKGRKQGKLLRYEVGIYVTPNPDNEEPEIGAKFKRYGDAYAFALHLLASPDATRVIIRN